MIARTTRRVAAKFGSSLPRSSLKFLRQELERLLEKVQKRSERIADLEKELADAQKKIAEQEKQITEQEKQITEQEKQITDLERQLALRKRNSTNSSKPPSSDGLAGEQRPRGRKHKRDRKSTRLNSSHGYISYAVFCLKKKKTDILANLTLDASTPPSYE